MVRHTHRRRQSRGRRRNTRRSRRTQRGGGILSFFGIGSKGLPELQQELAAEQDPIKKAEIQEEISIEQAKQIKDRTVTQIKERGANGAALSSTSVNTNVNRDINGRFQSSNGNGTANGMGMGAAASSSMFGGRRRRSHRRR